MNRHAVITGIAIAAILASVAYSGLNVYAADQLGYRWAGSGDFSFFAMSNGGNVEFCNPTPVWADIASFRIDLFLDTKNLGTFHADAIHLNPSSTVLQRGGFVSDGFVEAQHVFMTLDFEFDSGDVRLDPDRMRVLVTTSTPILGLIPYSSSSQYAGIDFASVMNGDGFQCQD